MNIERKEYKIFIFGQEFSIVSDESEQDVLLIEQQINDIASALSGQMNNLDTKKLAILTSLQLASKMVSSNKKNCEYDFAIEGLVQFIDSQVE